MAHLCLRFDPYSKTGFATCRICKSSVHQSGSHYCQGCAYKKGIHLLHTKLMCFADCMISSCSVTSGCVFPKVEFCSTSRAAGHCSVHLHSQNTLPALKLMEKTCALATALNVFIFTVYASNWKDLTIDILLYCTDEFNDLSLQSTMLWITVVHRMTENFNFKPANSPVWLFTPTYLIQDVTLLFSPPLFVSPGICAMCGKKVLDTKNYKQTSV